MIRLLILLVTISSIHCLASSEYLKFLASQHADRFEEAFQDAFEDRGAEGVRVYFADNFKAIDQIGQVSYKEDYLKLLLRSPRTVKFFFPPQRTAFFDFDDDSLLVRFYEEHILYSFRLVPDHRLYGGYQLERLSMADRA